MRGLSPEIQRDLILSVGTRQARRRLSPIEVAEAVETSLASGSTVQELAAELGLHPTMVLRFRRLLKLPPDIRDLVDWWQGEARLSFEAASHIARLPSSKERQEVAEAALKHGLGKVETIQIVQIRERSGRPMAECIGDVLRMRPQIEKRHILIGAITSEKIRATLRQMTQEERDQLFKTAVTHYSPELPPWEGRLGTERFTLLGSEAFGAAVQRLPGGFEEAINTYLEEEISQRGEGVSNVAPVTIDVSAHGAVMLGNKVTCDGFIFGFPYRVQTHIHEDHMEGFDSSKGYQHILMSEATKGLLTVEFDADIEYRSNINAIPLGSCYCGKDIEVELLSSGHMVGSAQVAVTSPGGPKVGYSGDFNWPLEKVIQVEALVVDSTYGSPNSKREYSQEDACSRFVELVLEKVKTCPVLIKAHPGTLQRALELLDGVSTCPILASRRLAAEAEVYRRFGYSIGTLIIIDSTEAQLAMKEGRYIRFYGKREIPPSDPSGNTVIVLSAYMTSPNEPLLEFSEHSYRIAISSHADFEGTLEYVKATGAVEVVTDNSRGGHAIDLALALKRYLGIEARPSSQVFSRYWGV
jgi:putative mRNA 3-end processing factor